MRGGREGQGVRSQSRALVSLCVSAHARAQVMKGFAKTVELAPGDYETVEFIVQAGSLMIWDNTAWDYVPVFGTFDFMVGASSRDIRLTQSVVIA